MPPLRERGRAFPCVPSQSRSTLVPCTACEPSARRTPAGSWGAAIIPELDVAPEDVQVAKHRYSGFWDNELDSVLRNLDVTTLLVMGINLDRCVLRPCRMRVTRVMTWYCCGTEPGPIRRSFAPVISNPDLSLFAA
jgi:hypothetical protein